MQLPIEGTQLHGALQQITWVAYACDRETEGLMMIRGGNWILNKLSPAFGRIVYEV